jgi:hypothetical protein
LREGEGFGDRAKRIYRTFFCTMTLAIAVAAEKFGLLGTVGEEMTGLVASAASDRGEILRPQRFRTLTRIVSLSPGNISTPASQQRAK